MSETGVAVEVEPSTPEVTVEINESPEPIVEETVEVPPVVIVEDTPSPTEEVAGALGLAEQIRQVVREEVTSMTTSLSTLISTHNHPELDHSNDPPPLPPAPVEDTKEEDEPYVHPWFRSPKRKKS